MRRRLHRLYERGAGNVALKATEFFRSNYDDFIAPVHGYMLRSFAVYLSHEFTEASLGILQKPMAHPLLARGWLGALTS